MRHSLLGRAALTPLPRLLELASLNTVLSSLLSARRGACGGMGRGTTPLRSLLLRLPRLAAGRTIGSHAPLAGRPASAPSMLLPQLSGLTGRTLCSSAPRGSPPTVGVGTFAVGMAAAALVGLGIGAMIPTGSKDAPSVPAEHAEAVTEGQPSGRTLTVYENVQDVAEEISRPGIIQDVERADVEALYEFQTCLASGGSGTVWRAVERSTGRAVAIKVIDKKLLLPSLLNMEVYAMLRCAGHPNIVELLAAYDVSADAVNPDGEWHLVMELASGGELFARLVEHGAYSEKVAAQVVAQVASAVYHMHSCGVCHRDIKPENVVLMSKDDETCVKLIDFGAAVVLEEDEQVISGGRVGTWTYWAPEQANEATPYDTAVDMWSVGVLLYIMLSGRHPFERPGSDPDEVLERILKADYTFDTHEWRSVSGRARKLVSQLMNPDPERRMSSTQLLSHSWVRGEGVSEKPLPDTQERLRAFKTASQAIHGSLLLAALLHQEAIRQATSSTQERSNFAFDQASGGTHAESTKSNPSDGQASELRRSTSVSRLRRTVSLSEGVGMIQPEQRYDVVRAAYELFDPTNKGHISAEDLRRVCRQLGLDITERDIDNMLSVLAPSTAGGGPDANTREISFDRFATMMHSSYRRRFSKGQTIFKQGDPVTGFYIIMSGELIVSARATSGSQPREVTRLGPGDFFGETGLLEGREKRNTTVHCSTDAELLMIDKDMFLQLAEAPQGTFASALAEKIRLRVEARQRARLKRAIELLPSKSVQTMRFAAGEHVYRQGEPASFFYLVQSGALEASFVSSTGERARLRTFGPGDQFGYDALVGESHDVSVVCASPVELLAIPREQLQKAFTEDSYLKSVWRAPADSASRLRRLMSINAVSQTRIGTASAGGVSPSTQVEQLPKDHFQLLLSRSRPAKLAAQQAAFVQGDTPSAVFLLKEGRCVVEVTSKAGETRVVAERKAGDHFGEGAVLERRPFRTSGVRCVADEGCNIGVLTRAVFEDILRANPNIGVQIERIATQRTRSRVRTVIQMAAERSDCSVVKLEPNQVLFHAGDKADKFFVVDQGSIELSFPDPTTGRLLPARKLQKGDIFGASGLLSVGSDSEILDENATRPNTATALEASVLKAVPHDRFLSIMRQDSQVVAALKRTNSVDSARSTPQREVR